MTDEADAVEAGPDDPRLGQIRNSGQPVVFPSVTQIAGIAAESALPDAEVKLWTTRSLTSDDPAFHPMAEHFVQLIQHEAAKNGVACPDVGNARMLLYIIRADGSAEVWADTAAVVLTCVLKRSVARATVVFEHDIADLLEVRFPAIQLDTTDRVFCVFRQGWRFGMAFDFSEEGRTDVAAFYRSLGRLHRLMRYHGTYTYLESPDLFDKMCEAGWFPFAEVITAQFQPLMVHLQEGWPLDEPERELLASFDKERIDHIYARWTAKPHMAKRAAVLREALDAFLDRRPVAVIKILITEIEGFLSDAYLAATGRPGKEKVVVRAAIDSVLVKTGGEESLMLPNRFAEYLTRNTYANFDPLTGDGTAGSRHAVGHGVASAESYTMVRALQMLLTVDQLAFFT